MRGRNTIRNRALPSPGEWFLNGSLSLLLAFALALGLTLSGGCLAAPAVLVSSAAVTAAALVTEGERAIQDPDETNAVVAKSGTDVDARSTEACPPGEMPGEADQVETRKENRETKTGAAPQEEPGRQDDAERPKT